MKRLLTLVLLLFGLTTLNAQTTRDSIVCSNCVPVTQNVPDSSVSGKDSTWNHFVRVDTVAYRDSVVVFCTKCVPVTQNVPDSSLTEKNIYKYFTRVDTVGFRDSVVKVPVTVASNEPLGFTTVVDNDWPAGITWTTPGVGGKVGPWTRYLAGNRGSSVVDNTAPYSPNVLEIDFSGTRQGTGPEHFSVNFVPNVKRTYLRTSVYVPLNYYGSTSGVQKLFHIWSTNDAKPTYLAGGSMVVPAIYGVGTNGLSFQIRVQGVSTTATQPISFNISCGSIQRGRWYTFEVLIVQNTGANANGQAYGWVNGALKCSRTNIQWSGSTVTVKQWTSLQLNPTYGGTGTAQNGVKLRYGKIRVSTSTN
jgi:hypothetical protein